MDFRSRSMNSRRHFGNGRSARQLRRANAGPSTVTALAGGVAVYAAVAGHSRATLAESALDQSTYDADRQAVTRWNTALVVAGSACAIGAIATGYPWYRMFHTDEARVSLHTHGDDLGIAVTGRF